MTPTEEDTQILTNARTAFFETCDIDRDELHDVYYLVAEAQAEREME